MCSCWCIHKLWYWYFVWHILEWKQWCIDTQCWRTSIFIFLVIFLQLLTKCKNWSFSAITFQLLVLVALYRMVHYSLISIFSPKYQCIVKRIIYLTLWIKFLSHSVKISSVHLTLTVVICCELGLRNKIKNSGFLLCLTSWSWEAAGLSNKNFISVNI